MPMPSPASFPDWLKTLRPLSKNSSWAQALELLRQAGFERHILVTRSAPDEDEDQDDDGPRPDRHYALLSHPDGFLVTLSSYCSGGIQTLNRLVYHYQTDIGADIKGERRESFASGSALIQGDGTAVFSGSHNVATSYLGSMGFTLEDCYANARPLPLSQWEPVFCYIEPRLFTAAPRDAVDGGPQHSALREEHAELVEADWSAFLARLPPSVALFLDPESAPSPRLARGNIPGGVNAYFARQLKEIGLNWPDPADSSVLISWSRALGQAIEERRVFAQSAREAERSGVSAPSIPAPVSPPFPEARVVGGSSVLHALASVTPVKFEHERGLSDMASQWIGSQKPSEVERLMGLRDARGRTPVGVALETWLAGYGPRYGPIPPFLAHCFDQGWLGAPGELGQVLYDALAPAGQRSFNDQRPLFEIGHARLLEQIDALSKSRGHEWVAPLSAKEGVITDPLAAIGVLLGKCIKADEPGPLRAYFEALSLRFSTRAPGARPACPPRL